MPFGNVDSSIHCFMKRLLVTRGLALEKYCHDVLFVLLLPAISNLSNSIIQQLYPLPVSYKKQK